VPDDGGICENVQMMGSQPYQRGTGGYAFPRISFGIVFGVVVLAAGLVWSSVAFSQVPTGAQPGVIDRPTPTPPVDLQRKPAGLEDLTPKAKEVPGADEVVANISKVSFKGMSVVSEPDLQAAVAKYLNRPITRGELAQLKFDIQRIYYDRGYILVRVVTPPQNLADGSLDVVVYEAVIGDIEIANDNVLRDWVVEALTSRVKPGAVFHERAVESMVNDFNDIKNVDATINLRPGSQTGATNLLLNIVKADEEEQNFSVSNYGSELTGEIVGTANFEKSNYFGAAEKFDVDVIISNGITRSVQGAFSIPTGFRNVKFDTRYIRSDIEVGDRLESLMIEGETQIFDAAFSSTLINMRRQVAQIRVGYQMRQHKSFLADVLNTKDNIRQVFLESSYLARLPNLLLFGSLRFAKGIDVFGAAELGEADATRSEGEPEVLLVQPTLFANYRPSENGQIRAVVTGQIANNTTLSSDLFILGGYGSVRGFEPAETTGEAGYQFSVEYTHKLWSGMWQGKNVTASAGPFVDGGKVWNRVEASVQDNSLVSVGFGAEIEAALTKYGPTKLRFDLAVPVGSYNSPEVEGTTIYLRFGQTF
jgi:hemolysin activation/secretion protein